MGEIKKPLPVKVFCGLIYKDDKLILKVEKKLSEKWGDIDLEAGPFPFNFTDYYTEEMGVDLKRSFISFSELVIPEKLWEWKIFTNRIEDEFSSNGKRRVNIDPGYIDFSKVILLSTKDFYHRIYLGEGIYAEVTMHFSKGKYHFFQWTYPDYRTGNYLKFFENLRRTYSKQIKDENVD